MTPLCPSTNIFARSATRLSPSPGALASTTKNASSVRIARAPESPLNFSRFTPRPPEKAEFSAARRLEFNCLFGCLIYLFRGEEDDCFPTHRPTCSDGKRDGSDSRIVRSLRDDISVVVTEREIKS